MNQVPVSSSPETTEEYGLIAYEGAYYGNIGDEIQSLAALRFLPRVDHLIPIDRLHSFRSPTGRPVKVIMNGYFSANPDAWPPSPDILPLFLSFHLSGIGLPEAPYFGPNAGKPPAEVWLSGEKLEYLKSVGTVGCRDLTTLAQMQQAGIDAYFSGCLTLTLRSKFRQRSRPIAVVDANVGKNAILSSMPNELRDRVIFPSHRMSSPGDWSQPMRFARAQELVWLYSSCALCVTSRLHCALPCLALGTPVIFVSTPSDPGRLAGWNRFLRIVEPEEISSLRTTDWTDPEPNSDRFIELRDDLIRQCRSFVSPRNDFH